MSVCRLLVEWRAIHNSPWAKLILREHIWFSVSKFIEEIFAHCEQIYSLSNFLGLWAIFSRRQQQANHAGRSSFEPAWHGMEMVSPPAGTYIPHSRFTTYCRTFLPQVLLLFPLRCPLHVPESVLSSGRWGYLFHIMRMCAYWYAGAVFLHVCSALNGTVDCSTRSTI